MVQREGPCGWYILLHLNDVNIKRTVYWRITYNSLHRWITCTSIRNNRELYYHFQFGDPLITGGHFSFHLRLRIDELSIRPILLLGFLENNTAFSSQKDYKTNTSRVIRFCGSRWVQPHWRKLAQKTQPFNSTASALAKKQQTKKQHQNSHYLFVTHRECVQDSHCCIWFLPHHALGSPERSTSWFHALLHNFKIPQEEREEEAQMSSGPVITWKKWPIV